MKKRLGDLKHRRIELNVEVQSDCKSDEVKEDAIELGSNQDIENLISEPSKKHANFSPAPDLVIMNPLYPSLGKTKITNDIPKKKKRQNALSMERKF